jgi:PilZ domain
MIYGFDASNRQDEEVGTLATDICIRVLNCAASGCLVESTRPLPVGSVATLRIRLSGGEFEETVQVVRCQQIAGGSVYHVATQFLPTSPATLESLRYLIRREAGHLGGWLRTHGDR